MVAMVTLVRIPLPSWSRNCPMGFRPGLCIPCLYLPNDTMDIWHFTEGTPTPFMKLSFNPLTLCTNDIGIMGKLDNQAAIIL